MFTYKLLDLPKLPTDLQEQLWEMTTRINDLEYINQAYNGHTVDRELFYNGKPLGTSASFKRRRLPIVFESWVKENIVNDFIDVGLTASEPGRMACGPHQDSSRGYTLLYVLQSGGEESKTCFWNPKVKTVNDVYCDYANIEEIASVHIPEDQWCIINSGGVVHSVENIPQGRITFQVSLKNNPFK